MNIALVCLSMGIDLQKYAAYAAAELARSHQVTLITSRDFERWLVPEGVDHLPLGQTRTPRLDPRLLNPVANVKLVRALRRIRPDVIHFTTAHPQNLLLSLCAPKAAKQIFTIHDPIPHPNEPVSGFVALYNRLVFHKLADHIVLHGKSHVQELEKLGVPTHHVSYAPLGEVHGPPSPPPFPEGPSILFFGRIRPYKGLDCFLKAAAILQMRIPDLRVIVAGAGDLTPYQEHLNVKNLELHNRFIPDEEEGVYFGDATVVALPYSSATQSGVIPVAYSYGRPVVATDVGSIPEMVVEGETGYLVPPNDPEALAARCEELLRSPDVCASMGANARAYHRRWLTPAAMAEHFDTLYREAVPGSVPDAVTDADSRLDDEPKRGGPSSVLRSRGFTATVDALIITLSVLLAFWVRYSGNIPELYDASLLWMLPLIVGVNLACFSMYELYRVRPRQWSELSSKLLAAHGLNGLLVLALSYLMIGVNFPRPVVLIAFAINVALSLGWRRVWWRQEIRAVEDRSVMLIDLASSIERFAPKVRAAFGSAVTMVPVPSSGDAALEEIAAAQERNVERGVHCLVIGAEVPSELKSSIAVEAFKRGQEVRIIPSWYDILISRASLTQVGDTPTLSITPRRELDRIPTGTRVFDLTLSLLGIIVSAPLMAVIALAVRLNSPGPALFRQERVGLNNRVFTLLKFRTMVADAESKSGPVLATENDPRLTRVGSFLRATRLDELPQLFNVLKGEMSLVGPRPERPYFVDTFVNDIPHYEQRHRVPGGVTGLAQVYGRYSTSPEDKLRYDLLYANSTSAMTDLRILLRTLETVLNRSRAQ